MARSGSIAVKPVIWHTTIISPIAPPCDTVFPGTQASACTAMNGADNGKVYRSSDDARDVLLRRMHAAQLSMLSRMYLYMFGQ